jgi:precorrin-6B methylase 2
VVLCYSTAEYRALARGIPQPARDRKAVDIGSAYGDATAVLAAALGPAGSVLGIDVSRDFISASSARFPSIRFARVDVLEDPVFAAQLLSGSDVVFIDIGGVRDAEALVRLVPLVINSSSGLKCIVIKSEKLHTMACSALALGGGVGLTPGGGSGDRESKGSLTPLPRGFWGDVCATQYGNIKARSTFKTHVPNAASAPGAAHFNRYPLKYPARLNAHGVEVCRFHNYSKAGCVRGAQGRCALDHDTCHFCGEQGHRAQACEAGRRTASNEANVAGELKPSSEPVRDPNDGTQGQAAAAAAAAAAANANKANANAGWSLGRGAWSIAAVGLLSAVFVARRIVAGGA